MKSKKIIEDIIGTPIHGYRAPGFSVTKDTPWFFEKLIEAGYTYDSSVFPAARQHGGMETHIYCPHTIAIGDLKLVESPISVANRFASLVEVI